MKINVTTKFTGVSDTEICRTAEKAIKEKLAKHGLSHLSVRAVSANNIEVDGGSQSDIDRANSILSGNTGVDSPFIKMEYIDTSSGVISMPSLGSPAKKKPKQ